MGIPDNWEAVEKGDLWEVINENGCVIASISKDKDAEANARLIAASPYMVSALKSVSELIGDEDLPDNGELSGAAICDMVRSAIELATKK